MVRVIHGAVRRDIRVYKHGYVCAAGKCGEPDYHVARIHPDNSRRRIRDHQWSAHSLFSQWNHPYSWESAYNDGTR